MKKNKPSFSRLFLPILFGGILVFVAACSSSKPVPKDRIERKIDELVSELLGQIPEQQRNLRLDYQTCTNYDNKATMFSKQITEKLLSIFSRHNMTISSQVDMMQISLSKQSAESEYLSQWQKRRLTGDKMNVANALLICQVGPEQNSLNNKIMLSVKIITGQGKSYYSTTKWYDI